MSTENLAGTSPVSFTAGGTIGQYVAVKGNGTTANSIVVGAAEGDVCIGVSLNSAVDGEQVKIQTVPGTLVKVTVSAAVNAWAQLECGASGKLVTAAGAAARSVAIATMASTADGDVIEAIWLGGGNGPANT